MKHFNGIKIYKIDGNTFIYAPNVDEAVKYAKETISENQNFEIQEISDEEFINGKVHHDVSGELDEYDAPLISYEECLLDTLKDGSDVGLLMVTEY